MNKWKHTLDLSGFYKTQEWDDSNAHECGMMVSQALRFLIDKHFKGDYTIDEICGQFDSICTEKQADEINDDNWEFHIRQLDNNMESYYFPIEPLEEFDECMRGLYDWADGERVWVKT